MLSPGITISVPSGSSHDPGHVRRAEVELRPVAVEERRVTAALFLLQHVHLGLELRVRGDRARLRQHLPALHVVALDAAQQAARRCRPPGPRRAACGTSRRPCTVVLRVSRMPTISISSPTFTMPRSIRPVTTVPRPVIVNTSSTGIRNGLSSVALRLRDERVARLHQLVDGLRRRTPSRRPPAP